MSDPVLLQSVERVLEDVCTHESIQAAEQSGWAPEIWQALAGVGLPWLGLDERAGGTGGELGDALEVLRIAGRHALPAPLAETGLLAGWLASGAGLSLGSGPVAPAPVRPDEVLELEGGRLSGRASRVPWARAAERIAALARTGQGWAVALVDPSAATLEPRVNLAGEPRDGLRFDAVEVESWAPAAPGVDPAALQYRGALTRVMLMSGALERMSELTLEYTAERHQFGRPVGRFQAVQQYLVSAAQDAALVGMAGRVAAREAERGPARFEIGAAKLLANRAAHSATRAAHQAHGAMGMTREYPLHHWSRRLWAWRSEYGDELAWSGRLGREVAAAGADALYPTIAGGSAAGSPRDP
ncbi:MAG: acyl-CoA dehydrogenase [Proteobacteria bacterium]|nr:acyl-CoA dehydrogenase [Pseudomonadota bacterium]